MAGYTRQSAGSILAGQDIDAAPLNAEFNALATAFDGSNGHNHSGGSGQGPQLDLTAAVTGVLPPANGGALVNNLAASVDPTVNDDSEDGYTAGSLWVHGTNVFVCTDATHLAAVWTQFQPYDAELAALAGLTSAADKLPYFTGVGTAGVTSLTAFARTILDDADATMVRTTLGLTIGSNVQAYNAKLADVAGLNLTQGDVLYYNGTHIVNLAAGTAGQFLQTNGAGSNPSLGASGSGDMLSTNNLSDVADVATAVTNLGLTIGTDTQAHSALLDQIAAALYAQGTILFYDGSKITTLPAGTAGYVLTTNGTAANPTWESAVMSANAILTALKTVDGSGSGLDADTLDGQDSAYYTDIVSRLGYTPVTQSGANTVKIGWSGTQVLLTINTTAYNADWPINITGDARTLQGNSPSYFLAASSYTASDVLSKLTGVDGSGSGLDADTVDGYHASAFLTSIPNSYGGVGTYTLAASTRNGDGTSTPNYSVGNSYTLPSLSGTWRCMGTCLTGSTITGAVDAISLFIRIA